MPVKSKSLYTVDAPPFVATLRDCAADNQRKIDRWYAEPIERCETLLDAYHAFAAQHVWTFVKVRPNPDPTEKLLFSAVHKNHFALFSTLELIRTGFFGPARILLRQVYEAQIMAKFAAVRGDNQLAQSWLAGAPVSIGAAVFPKIVRPPTQSLRLFWKTLHPFVHASPSSQQVSPHAEDNADELGLDLMLLSLLLATQYHLLSRHSFSRASQYYAERYDLKNDLPPPRTRIREALRANAAHFSAEGKALVRAFRATWVLAP